MRPPPRPVPDHLLRDVSYQDVVAAYGMLSHVKYAMERAGLCGVRLYGPEAAITPKPSETVVVETAGRASTSKQVENRLG
jgi:hypothetical protein